MACKCLHTCRADGADTRRHLRKNDRWILQVQILMAELGWVNHAHFLEMGKVARLVSAYGVVFGMGGASLAAQSQISLSVCLSLSRHNRLSRLVSLEFSEKPVREHTHSRTHARTHARIFPHTYTDTFACVCTSTHTHTHIHSLWRIPLPF